jgi:tol-pal system protein YbgF
MMRSRYRFCITAFAAVSLLYMQAAAAQERSGGGLLDNLFSRGGQQNDQQDEQRPAARPRVAQSDDDELSARVSRLEGALRQLTGTLEELQHQNQMLQMQLKRMQDDTEYRGQQQGGRAMPSAPPSQGGMPAQSAPPPTASGRRSDVFDPLRDPNAPGVPRTLGNSSAAPPPVMANEPPAAPHVGAPGGRAAGEPLDLSTLGGRAAPDDQREAVPPQTTQSAVQPPIQSAPPARNSGARDVQLATLPPSASPKDEYQLAYGYVVHKDYALAEQAFRDFLKKYPNERLLPEAQYWLGESQFQQQRYRDAAEAFLAVSTKYAESGKAPDALLRLGESLAALHQKEAACATFAEVGRKYPRASASVKQGVTREQKRAHC